MFGHDLEKILPCEVVAGLEIDDLDVAPVANEARDVLERHVVRCLGVVEPSAGVALYEKRFVGHVILRGACIAAVQLTAGWWKGKENLPNREAK